MVWLKQNQILLGKESYGNENVSAIVRELCTIQLGERMCASLCGGTFGLTLIFCIPYNYYTHDVQRYVIFRKLLEYGFKEEEIDAFISDNGNGNLMIKREKAYGFCLYSCYNVYNKA